MNDLIIAKVDQARNLLAECTTAEQAKRVKDMATAVEIYAKRQKLGKESIDYAHEIVIDLAIERNATHGLQLSQEDKRDMARKIYHVTPEKERNEKKKYLAKILSVSERTIREWLSRIDKDSKEARDKRIFELWMACWTQDAIAEAEGVSQKEVSLVLEEMAELPKDIKPIAEHLIDFDVPIYNVWKQQE
jgi:hypothetical protein